MCFSPADPTFNTLYVGTNASGVWKTTNAKAANPNWTCLQDLSGAPGMGVQSIVVDPTGQVIYIATGTTSWGRGYGIGILKSTDGGQTWFQYPNGLNFSASGSEIARKIILDPTNPNNLFALTSTHVFKTIDGGQHWGTTLNPYPSTPIPLFTYTQTTDAFLNGSSLVDMELKPGDPNTVYISSSGHHYINTVPPIYNGATFI